MPHLHDLEAEEVSLVRSGANLKKFLVFKSRDDRKVAREILDLVQGVDAKAMTAIEKAIKEIAQPPPEDDQALAAISPRAQAALKAVARILVPFKDEITDEMIDRVLESIGMTADDTDDEDPDAQRREDSQMDVKKEHLDGAKEAAVKAFREHCEKMGYAKSQTPKVDVEVNKGVKQDDLEEEEEEEDRVAKSAEPILKADGTLNVEAVPAEMRPFAEMIMKSQADLRTENAELKKEKEAVQKTNADLQKQISEERTARREKEMVAKAAGFKNFVGDKVELAKHLVKLQDSSPELYESTIKNMEAVEQQAEAAQKQIFKELGSNQGANGGSQGLEAKIQAIADRFVEKDGTMTAAQAYEKALSSPEGKQLYNEYKQARGGV